MDLKLLALVQDGFPISSRPFRDLGLALGLEEDEVISRLDELQKEGLVRRI
ncbi:MAG TPA: Lrp/AsnC family transcriptional regulator, partial [Methanothrix sp.]|nr:Lrp/AsnC family transcriptional regulator [Methanothrix sp.]